MTGHRATSWWRPRTLRRQLVVGVAAIVTIVVLAVGIVSVLSLRTYFNVMNNAEVDESLDALVHSYARYRHGDVDHPEDVAHALLGFTGQNAGNIIAVIHRGDVIGTAVFYEDDPRAAALRRRQRDQGTAMAGRPVTHSEAGRTRFISGEQPKCRCR